VSLSKVCPRYDLQNRFVPFWAAFDFTSDLKCVRIRRDHLYSYMLRSQCSSDLKWQSHRSQTCGSNTQETKRGTLVIAARTEGKTAHVKSVKDTETASHTSEVGRNCCMCFRYAVTISIIIDVAGPLLKVGADSFAPTTHADQYAC
jgi:hypothetical protein